MDPPPGSAASLPASATREQALRIGRRSSPDRCMLLHTSRTTSGISDPPSYRQESPEAPCFPRISRVFLHPAPARHRVCPGPSAKATRHDGPSRSPEDSSLRTRSILCLALLVLAALPLAAQEEPP